MTNVSIADLAAFALDAEKSYEENADLIVAEYKFERATIIDRDVYEGWNRVKFIDGSILVILSFGEYRVNNAHCVDWDKPGAMTRAVAVEKELKSYAI